MHDLERRIIQLQVASDVARDAATLGSVDDLLARSINLVRERFGFYNAGIFMLDERGEYAILRAASGEAGQQLIEARSQAKNRGCGHCQLCGRNRPASHCTGCRSGCDLLSKSIPARNPF